MEKQESTSKWDDLAREIGAEISPEIIEREEAAASKSDADTVGTRPEGSGAAEPTAPPKRAAVNWSSLATELGLPPLPPEPEPAPKPAPPQQHHVAHEEGAREQPAKREERQPRRERPQRQDAQRERRRDDDEPRSRQVEREQRAAGEETREPAERGGRPRRARGGMRRSERERDARMERAEREDRSERGAVELGKPASSVKFDEGQESSKRREGSVEGAVIREDERTEAPPQRLEPTREEPLKAAAISLWHKIFGTPAEQEAKLTDESAEQSDVVAPSNLRDEPTDAGGFVDVHTDEGPADELAAEKGRGEESEAMMGAESDEHRRGRPRRRRGRGRSRRSEALESGGVDEESTRSPQRSAATNDRRRRHRDDEVDDEAIKDDVTQEDGTGEDVGDELVGVGVTRRSALQRAIPSWEEAIGFIVDTNLQDRSQRKATRSGPRESSGGGGGRGNNRGRSRGRRKPS